MARILVTGSQGQVGHCLTQQLQGKVELLAVDRDVLDITHRDAVFRKVERFQPDVIINAAAHTAVDRAEKEVELSEAINSKGPQYLAEAAEQVNSLILHISTDYVFAGDAPLTHSYQENESVNPQGVYGRSKLAGEKAVAKACSRHIILRTAWVFGEHGNNFVKTMLRLGKARDTLSVIRDQVGGPTYAGDIAAALIKMTETALDKKSVQYGVYHFTGQPFVSWFEFAEAIFAKAVSQGVLEKSPTLNAITTAEYPTLAKRPANSKLDLSKINTAFDLHPSDWQKALDNITAYTD